MITTKLQNTQNAIKKAVKETSGGFWDLRCSPDHGHTSGLRHFELSALKLCEYLECYSQYFIYLFICYGSIYKMGRRLAHYSLLVPVRKYIAVEK